MLTTPHPARPAGTVSTRSTTAPSTKLGRRRFDGELPLTRKIVILGRRDVSVAVEAEVAEDAVLHPDRPQLAENGGAGPVGASDRLQHDVRRLCRVQDELLVRGRPEIACDALAGRVSGAASGGRSDVATYTRERPGRRVGAGRGSARTRRPP
jgi:hypothetical protein